MPKSNVATTLTPVLELYVVSYGSKNGYKRKHMVIRDWTITSTITNYYRLCGLHDHFMNIRIFALITIKIFI